MEQDKKQMRELINQAKNKEKFISDLLDFARVLAAYELAQAAPDDLHPIEAS